MSVAVIFVLAVILFMLVLLVVTPLGPDTVLMGGLTLFLVSGIISPAEALSGLSNEAMVSVAVLYVVGAGVRETGGTDLIIHRILGRPRSIADGQLKLMAPVAALSAFLNNTPVVAVMIPAVLNWSRRFSLQVSRLLIELCLDVGRHLHPDRHQHQFGSRRSGQVQHESGTDRLL